jgi:hypothetical protein
MLHLLLNISSSLVVVVVAQQQAVTVLEEEQAVTGQLRVWPLQQDHQ